MQRQIGLLGAVKVLFYFLALPCTLSPQVVVGTELTEDTTWSGVVTLEDIVSVPAGIVLTIEPGTTVQMKNAVSIIIYGQLLADGTDASQIRFTRTASGIRWKQIRFADAADSRLTNCIFEYADCAGEHQDYYVPGPRRYLYHEAIVLLSSHVDFEKCVFQNLPSAGGEGDAIAVMSDDANYPGDSSANIRGCRFLDIGQGIHTRYSYVLVEDCYFQHKNGDNDDVDLWGESTPPPLIRNNLFDVPVNEDRINPTKCSAIIIGNVIKGSTDHAIVLRDKCSPIVANNLIYNCSNAGIAVENTCTAMLVNNTIKDVSPGSGIKLFDLGRAGSPYFLTKGGGTATIINCIVWDCQTTISVSDSQQLDGEPNAGSHITVKYCDIEGGRASVSISQQGSVPDSTVTWLEGNIDADPQFVDPNYHLKSQAGHWDPKTQTWVKDDVTSPCIDTGDPSSDWTAELWPHGQRINMGAFGGTPQASMSLSVVGNIADLDHNDVVDANDLLVLADMWLAQGVLLQADLNYDAMVNFGDFAKFASSWRTNVGSGQEPFQIILGDKAEWSQQYEGYDPNLPGYHIVGDIASVTMRARTDDLPEALILAIRTSPGMPPMLESFTFAAPCVMLSGEPFKGAELGYFTRANTSLEWQGPSKVQTGTYFKFDVVGDEVYVTFLPPAIELLKVECKISWIDWYR